MKRTLLVGGLFLLLTVVLTYPLVVRMGSSVRDLGDPLLNTWILSWDIDHIARLDFGHFFDANIFYPQSKTLAYSEFLIPQALVALPAKLLTGNPIFAHNFVLLFAFLTTGLGMYFLARHLTGNVPAAVTAGVIFAFSPFMFSHLYQVQILTAGGIPLAFFFLHKFFENDRLKDLLLFGLFFVLQALANGYYALYLLIFSGLFIAVFAIVRKRYREGRFWLRLAVCGLLIGLCLVPFFYQYYAVQKQMGFSREISSPASLKSFLATPRINDLYGKITSGISRGERDLFPGAVAFLLACFGAIRFLRFKKKEKPLTPPPGRGPKWYWPALLWMVTLLTLFYAGVFYLVLGRGGLDLSLGPLGLLHAHSLIKVALVLLLLLAAGFVLRRKSGVRLLPVALDWDSPWIYVLILALAFLFSFGAGGPYLILHNFVPGFKGLRSAARFHIFFMFALAVLAAFGLNGFSRLPGKSKLRAAAFLVLPVLIVGEYLSIPVPLENVPVKSEIPEVYQWIAGQKGPVPVAELPFPAPGSRLFDVECFRVYYSAYHRKPIVNGYSGFFPPLYRELQRRYVTQPVRQVVDDLRSLGVRLIIVHSDELKNQKIHPVLDRLSGFADQVREVRRFGTDIVFEVLPGTRGQKSLAADPNLTPLAPEGWSARAGFNSDRVRAAFDGRLDTRWDTGRVQEKGQWFELDLGRTADVRGIIIKLGDNATDYPRGLRVDVSTDMRVWTTIAEEDDLIVPIRSLLRPGQAVIEIPFGPAEARGIRLVQTGKDREFYWSIPELEVLVPKAANGH